jgi:LAO/AO transport system kinase
MAARDRLGGLAALTVSAMVLMRALYDIVLIETVGVGQSETDVVGVADTVILCVQPGSGDSLQFMKAGIAEIPHIVAVTKADMGMAAERARADVAGALQLTEAIDDWQIPVLMLSALQHQGVDALIGAIEAHVAFLKEGERLAAIRKEQAALWLVESVRERFGRDGLRRAGHLGLEGEDSPFRRLAEVSRRLSMQ